MHTSGVDLRTRGAWWSGTGTAHKVRVCEANFLRIGLRICRFRTAMEVAAGLAVWDQWLGTCSLSLHYHIIYDVKPKLKHEEDRTWWLGGLNLFTSHAKILHPKPFQQHWLSWKTKLMSQATTIPFIHVKQSIQTNPVRSFPLLPVLDINILDSKVEIMYAKTTCTVLFWTQKCGAKANTVHLWIQQEC